MKPWSLSEAEKIAAARRYWGGEAPSAIAADLGVTVSTVIHHARLRSPRNHALNALRRKHRYLSAGSLST